MVTAALVDQLIEDGRRLLTALDDAGMEIQAALWFYDTESEEWRLLIAWPELQRQGPLKAYERIQAVLDGITHRSIALWNIAVVSPNDPVIRALRTVVRTDRAATGIRISRNTIDNVFIEDAYIYRLL